MFVLGKMSVCCYGKSVSPQNPYVDVLMLYGEYLEMGLWEIIRVRLGHGGGALMMALVPL